MTGDRSDETDRAQLVLLGAALIAIAFVPLVLAYLQLGYHADVRASGVEDDPTADARAALVPAVHDASADVPGTYTWSDRAVAVEVVRGRLAPTVDSIETGRVDSGVYRNVSYAHGAAAERAADRCPGGPAREFGSCEVIDGLVVQDRADRTHVLAVAVEITTTTERERTSVTTVIEVWDADR